MRTKVNTRMLAGGVADLGRGASLALGYLPSLLAVAPFLLLNVFFLVATWVSFPRNAAVSRWELAAREDPLHVIESNIRHVVFKVLRPGVGWWCAWRWLWTHNATWDCDSPEWDHSLYYTVYEFIPMFTRNQSSKLQELLEEWDQFRHPCQFRNQSWDMDCYHAHVVRPFWARVDMCVPSQRPSSTATCAQNTSYHWFP